MKPIYGVVVSVVLFATLAVTTSLFTNNASAADFTETTDFDQDTNRPAFPMELGTNSVKGTLGPLDQDSEDPFDVVIPSGLRVTSVTFDGPSGSHSLVGCGLIGETDLNQTFGSNSTACILSYVLTSDSLSEAAEWSATIVTEVSAPTPTPTNTPTSTPVPPTSTPTPVPPTPTPTSTSTPVPPTPTPTNTPTSTPVPPTPTPTPTATPEPPTPTVEELVDQLVEMIENGDLPRGLTRALVSKLENGRKKFSDYNIMNDTAGLNAFEAFINHVNALRGKKIPEELAAQLVTDAEEIIFTATDY